MSVSSSRAVSMMTGTGRSACTRRQTSRPSMPGSMTSSTMTSGRSLGGGRDAGRPVRVRSPPASPRHASGARRPRRWRARPRPPGPRAPPARDVAFHALSVAHAGMLTTRRPAGGPPRAERVAHGAPRRGPDGRHRAVRGRGVRAGDAGPRRRGPRSSPRTPSGPGGPCAARSAALSTQLSGRAGRHHRDHDPARLHDSARAGTACWPCRSGAPRSRSSGHGRRRGRLALVLVNGFSMLLGELVPKNLALSVPMATARAVAPAQLAFTAALRPVIARAQRHGERDPAAIRRAAARGAVRRSVGDRSSWRWCAARPRSARSTRARRRCSTNSIELNTLTAVDVMTDRTRMEVVPVRTRRPTWSRPPGPPGTRGSR